MTCHGNIVPMQFRHISVSDKECVIVCAIDRVTPPWEGHSKHFAQEFEASAKTLMREMPVKRDG